MDAKLAAGVVEELPAQRAQAHGVGHGGREALVVARDHGAVLQEVDQRRGLFRIAPGDREGAGAFADGLVEDLEGVLGEVGADENLDAVRAGLDVQRDDAPVQRVALAGEDRDAVEGDGHPEARQCAALGVGGADAQAQLAHVIGQHEGAADQRVLMHVAVVAYRREDQVGHGLARGRLGAGEEGADGRLMVHLASLGGLEAQTVARRGVGHRQAAEDDGLIGQAAGQADRADRGGIGHHQGHIADAVRAHGVDLDPLAGLGVRHAAPDAVARRVDRVAHVEARGGIGGRGARRGQRGGDLAAEDAGEGAGLGELEALEGVAGGGLGLDVDRVGLGGDAAVAVADDDVERVARAQAVGQIGIAAGRLGARGEQQALELGLGTAALGLRRTGADRQAGIIHHAQLLGRCGFETAQLQEPGLDLVADGLLAAELQHAVGGRREAELGIDHAAEEVGIARRGVERHALDVLALRGSYRHRNAAAAAGHAEVAVLHGDRQRLSRTDDGAVGEVADEHGGIVDLVVGGEFPGAVQQARLGVCEVKREDVVELLAGLLVVLAVEGDACEEVVRLGLHLDVGLRQPVLDDRLGGGGIADLDEQVDVAEHGAPGGARLAVGGVVAQRLVLEARGLEVALVAEALGARQQHRGRQFGRQRGLACEELVGDGARLQQQRVLGAARAAELLDAPDDEVRRQLDGLALEGSQGAAQQRPGALGVVALELVGGDVERIGRVVLGHRVDAGHVGGRLGAQAREAGGEGAVGGGHGTRGDVHRLPAARLPGRLELADQLTALIVDVVGMRGAVDARDLHEVNPLGGGQGRGEGIPRQGVQAPVVGAHGHAIGHEQGDLAPNRPCRLAHLLVLLLLLAAG